MNHDAVTIGVPVLAILFAALINRSDLHRLEDRIDKRFDDRETRFEALFAAIDARFDMLHRGSREFHGTLGEHRAKLDRLENL